MEQRTRVEGRWRRVGHEPAPVEDEDTIAEAEQLGQLRGAEKDDPPLVRHVANEPEDFAFRAYVNAACRVVEQDDVRCDLEPLADDDLLLVAARELMHLRRG